MMTLALILAPVVATALLLLQWRLAPHLGLIDRPSPRKDHGRPTPLVGGPALLAGAWLLPWLLGLPLPGLLLTGAALITLVGLLDDRFGEGFPWPAKLAGQLTAGTLIGIALFPDAPWAWCLCPLWAGILQNAINFQDNINGLCSGTGVLLAALFLVLPGAAPLTMPLAGCLLLALLPLLALNFPRGRVFLGDQGSLLLGYTVAVLTLAPLPGAAAPEPARLLVPLLPLLDLGATLLYRHRRGLPLVKADHNHLSHRLRRIGATPVTAVLFLWFLTLVLGGGAPLLVGWVA